MGRPGASSGAWLRRVGRLSLIATLLLAVMPGPAAQPRADTPITAEAAPAADGEDEGTVAWLMRLLAAGIAAVMGSDGEGDGVQGRSGSGGGVPGGGTPKTGRSGGVEGMIERFVEEQRRKLPLRMNDEAQLVDIRLSQRNISFYVALDYDVGEVNRQALKPMQEQVRARACADRGFRMLAALDAKATYVLTDSRNRTLYRFFLDPKHCG